jgi:hypothetical protein
VDVSNTGDLVLATCASYLLLARTAIEGSDLTGFKKNLGANKVRDSDRAAAHTRRTTDQTRWVGWVQPPPLRLFVKPEDLVAMGGEPVRFTRAYFNTGEYSERFIIARCVPPKMVPVSVRDSDCGSPVSRGAQLGRVRVSLESPAGSGGPAARLSRAQA